MRIATGCYSHETNSFSTLPITQADMDRLTVTAENFLAVHSGTHSTIGGIIDEAARLNIELVPTTFFHPCPSAPSEKAAFEGYVERLVSLLWEAHCQQPLDGIMLDMHGAGVSYGHPDVEAYILHCVRQRFGPDMPIAISLDLHGNVSEEMHRYADIIVGYKCYPHVDGYETTTTAMRLLHKMILQGKPLGKAFIKLPWHISPAHGCTLSGPACEVKQYMEKCVESAPELLDATFFHGFAYADIPQAGASVVAVAETQEAADHYCKEIARFAWSLRYSFTVNPNSARQAMDLAQAGPFPVVINESSDNPGGGAPGDGTHLLREMLLRDLPGSAFGHIYDPEVVKQATEAGVGSYIRCSLGAKNDDRHGTPIELEKAYVKVISDGKFICKNPMSGGNLMNIGPAVLLVVGNVQIVVSSVRSQTLDDNPFLTVGIDWTAQKYLALKSTHHFKGWWATQNCTIIPCDSPGIHCADLNTFDHKYMDHSYFPFKDVDWSV